MLSIYNTYTKRKEVFEPINPPEVKMYVCGPTVYDYFHIGNARSFVMADIVQRYLEYSGYKVKFLMNLTDVDDKIIKKSNEEKEEFSKVAAKYVKAFFEDLRKLKVKEADLYPKATDHMNDIINTIENLEDKGFAYNVNGNVFFDVSRFNDYGKLSGKNIDDLIAGARIEVNEEKRNPLDFALWKKAKTDEPYWNSRWGKGRPGWHIECSVMSCKHLGEYFDIHAGGNDLIFPHHENEIAQSVAAYDSEFVKYWIHFGFLNIEDEKMSKSLGNFFTARDVLARYSAEAIRLFFAQAYYRGPLNFSDELLAAAERGLERLDNFADTLFLEFGKNNDTEFMPDFDIAQYENRFRTAMDDDFNTAQAVAVIFDFVRDVNKVISESEKINFEFFINVRAFLERTAEGVLGILDFSTSNQVSNKELTHKVIQLLINVRTDAKSEKNYTLADKIRDELKSIGIELKDSKDGTTFRIVK
ncbi:MAG: cysteine--tRNA ligase [Ignavibacteria bacterium]|jgi:cysteinyl-tRNA synthetase